jgi:membrane-associated protease RseP (regulator of RpoE activity)
VDPAGSFPLPPPEFVWRPRPKFQNRVWLHAFLFVLTFATTTFTGIGHYVAFRSEFLSVPLQLTATLIGPGLFYSVTILAILGCHELGHYFACRYYDVDASLPYFLPIPPLPIPGLEMPLTGTLGAFIRIREPIPTKRMLFDIGIAGPLAGFAVAVPALLLGVSLSHVVKLPSDFKGLALGEPALFKLVEWLMWGSVPDGYSLNLHPIAFAAWFGLLATALNLFPVGQLDGGHICYAVLGRRSIYVTLIMVVVAIALSFLSPSWIVWTFLMIVMLFVFGPRHPRTFDEEVPLDRPRRWIALVALIILALCFTPAPISPFDLISR